MRYRVLIHALSRDAFLKVSGAPAAQDAYRETESAKEATRFASRKAATDAGTTYIQLQHQPVRRLMSFEVEEVRRGE